MRYFILSAAFLLMLLQACSDDNAHVQQDSTPQNPVFTGTPSDNTPFGVAHNHLVNTLQPIVIPDWIHVDSARNYKVAVSHEEALLLFPAGFGIPEEVAVSAFAKQDIDSVTSAIWYYMEVASADGSGGKDIWMVLYNDTAGATASHCFSTKGVGLGYAKIDSPTSFREVLVDGTEKKSVTTKTVTIANGKFVVSNEKTSTFSPSAADQSASLALINTFFQ